MHVPLEAVVVLQSRRVILGLAVTDHALLEALGLVGLLRLRGLAAGEGAGARLSIAGAGDLIPVRGGVRRASRWSAVRCAR